MVETSGRKGRLIAICGIDGSGKATQSELLAKRAEAEGYPVKHISFPRYGESLFADLVERYLRGEFAARASDVNPYLAALPYALDRWQAAPMLREWLAQGHLTICNRYVAANMAHQGSKLASAAQRRAFFNWVAELEYGVLKLPEPDLHVLLDMPPALAAKLARARKGAAGPPPDRDIHEQDIAYLEATARAYLEIAGEEPGRWAIIECARGDGALQRQDIAERLWAEVKCVL